jgi:NAD(P)-dependent dehydrogenase (short-subunit alcohol dehydrogenase family)
LLGKSKERMEETTMTGAPGRITRRKAGANAPDFSVNGQHVLISGGAGGIGTAFARAFRDGGATVTICDLKAPANDEGFRFESLDVRDDEAVVALAAKIDTLHVLIHCAGRLIRHEEHKPEVFRDIVDIHLVGNMRLATAFRPHLAKTKGCLINIGSMYSYFGSAMIPAYTAAKTAIVGLTKSLAVAYAEDGIRVNAIAPGWINTEISRRGREEEAFNAKVMARLPTKRWSEPEELAGTAVFLASPASRLINGVTIPVDGGYVAA